MTPSRRLSFIALSVRNRVAGTVVRPLPQIVRARAISLDTRRKHVILNQSTHKS